MAVFLSKDRMEIVEPLLLRKTWQEEGIQETSIDQVLKTANNISHPEMIIDAQMLIELISGMDEKELLDIDDFSSIIEIARWKLQGTDGVRGIVDSKEIRAHQALIEFVHNSILTPKFCYLYILAFIKMVLSSSQYTHITHIAFGEDGRDYYQKSPLRKSIHKAISDKGITMIDIGIIPTPYIAQYSMEHQGIAIMLTASHNPSSYNGIKLFVDGNKLYPEGELGEYVLSSLVLQESRNEEESNKPLIPPLLWNQKNLYASTLLSACKDIPKTIFKECPLLIDCANGAASSIFKEVLSSSSIPHIPIACTPGINTINKDSGVALLEDISQTLSYETTLPNTILELFHEARRRNAHKAFAIVLDGDGDRAFLLQYRKQKDELNDKVLVYNGDSLGYLITSYFLKKRESNLIFVHTIESNFSLSTKVHEGIKVKTSFTCVGDRWLVYNINKADEDGIGCEKSGHVVFPFSIGDERTLYSGNGMLTALYALSYLIENNFEPPVAEGFNRKEVIRGKIIYQFYRNSSLWREIHSTIIQLLDWKYEPKIIDNELHLLFISLFDKKKEIGWLYMRKSGTEEKMSYSISLLAEYKEEGMRLMEHLKEKISYLCSIKAEMIST